MQAELFWGEYMALSKWKSDFLFPPTFLPDSQSSSSNSSSKSLKGMKCQEVKSLSGAGHCVFSQQFFMPPFLRFTKLFTSVLLYQSTKYPIVVLSHD